MRVPAWMWFVCFTVCANTGLAADDKPTNDAVEIILKVQKTFEKVTSEHKASETAVKNAETALKTASDALKQFKLKLEQENIPSDLQKLLRKSIKVNQNIAADFAERDALREKIRNAEQALVPLVEARTKTQAAHAAAKTQFDAATTDSKKLESQIKTLAGELDAFEKSIDQHQAALVKAEKALADAGTDEDKRTAAAKSVKDETEAILKLVKQRVAKKTEIATVVKQQPGRKAALTNAVTAHKAAETAFKSAQQDATKQEETLQGFGSTLDGLDQQIVSQQGDAKKLNDNGEALDLNNLKVDQATKALGSARTEFEENTTELAQTKARLTALKTTVRSRPPSEASAAESKEAVAAANAVADINKSVADTIRTRLNDEAGYIRKAPKLETRDLPEFVRLYTEFSEKTTDDTPIADLLAKTAELRKARDQFINETSRPETKDSPIAHAGLHKETADAWDKVFSGIDKQIAKIEVTRDVKQIRAAHDAVRNGLVALQKYERSRGGATVAKAGSSSSSSTSGTVASSAAVIGANLGVLYPNGVPYCRDAESLKRALEYARKKLEYERKLRKLPRY